MGSQAGIFQPTMNGNQTCIPLQISSPLEKVKLQISSLLEKAKQETEGAPSSLLRNLINQQLGPHKKLEITELENRWLLTFHRGKGGMNRGIDECAK